MPIPVALRSTALVLALSLTPAAADDGPHAHAAHGKVGTVKFPTSCSPAVQPRFERAVAMLHSFWYDQAELAFTQLAQQEPDCALAHWGVAMSLHRPLWSPATPAEVQRGAAAIARAQAATKATPRERAYIAALATVYDPALKSLGARNKAFADAMEKVYRAYPDDPEAAIFYALALRSTAAPTDKSYAVQKQAGGILDPLYRRHPQHPGLAHYVIHNYDYPELAHRALDAARRYAKVAPAAPHAQHMPSHIFIRLGLWPDAIRSNLDAAAAGQRDFAQSGSQAALAEKLHAMDYLVYGYLQRGEVSKAVALWEELKRTTNADWSYFSAYHSAAAIPARITLETRRWSDAAALSEPTFTGGSYWTHVASGITHWARALGAARTGNVSGAKQSIAGLEALRDQLQRSGHTDGEMTVEILVRSAQGWTALAEKKTDVALERMRAAADLEDRTDKHPVTPGSVLPAREQLADLLLELNRPAEALAEYEASLKTAPNRYNSLRGAVSAAKAAGQPKAAAKYNALLKKVAPSAEPERASQAQARARP